MTLVINTLVFKDKLINGSINQVDIVDMIKGFGADGIEVRREYFKNFKNELPKIKERAKKNGLIVNYSVPELLFSKDGGLNKELTKYFDEARTMGATKIKFNIGYFVNFKGNLKEAMDKLPLDEIEMNVENDKTTGGGTVQSIKKFFDALHKNKIGYEKIGFVYDFGNWAFMNEDAVMSADALFDYTKYIHLKNVIKQDEKLSVSNDLNIGIYNWKNILNHLPSKVQFAIEYSLKSDNEIREQVQMVKRYLDSSESKILTE